MAGRICETDDGLLGTSERERELQMMRVVMMM